MGGCSTCRPSISPASASRRRCRFVAARNRAEPQILPVSRLENRLFIAMSDPLNVLAVDDVKRITKLGVSTMIASEKAITDKLNSL